MTHVAVVVVSYHSAADLPDCLAALRRAGEGLDVELVVVDNGSGDASASIVRQQAPAAEVVELCCNTGFAAACHIGVQRTTAPYIVFVNPDSQVDPSCLRSLLACAQRNTDAAIVGGCGLLPDGTPDPRSWWNRPTLWSLLCFACGLSSLRPGSRVWDPESGGSCREGDREVPVVSGSLMLVRRDAWLALEGFDRRYFVYGEDADLCLRAWEAGHRVIVTPAALTRHVGGQSSSSQGERLVLLFRGKVTLLRRHLRGVQAPVGIGLLRAGVAARAVGARVRLQPTQLRQGRPVVGASAWTFLHAHRAQWISGWEVVPRPCGHATCTDGLEAT